MIYYILTIHWIADFIVQTDKMAKNKSTSWMWLISHILTYSACLLPFGLFFAAINGAAHFIVDAITSRVTSYYWKKENRKMFFIVIGLDQLLHTATLVYTIKYVNLWWLP